MYSCSHDQINDHGASKDVADRMCGICQRTANIPRYLGPVERERYQGKSGEAAEELADNDRIRLDPGGKGKHAQEGSDVAREPVPLSTSAFQIIFL